MTPRTAEVSLGIYTSQQNLALYDLERLLRKGACSWIGAVAVGTPAFRYDSCVIDTLLAERWSPRHQCSDTQYVYKIINTFFLDTYMVPNIANNLPDIDTDTHVFVVIGEQHSLADTARKRVIVMLVDMSEFMDVHT
jgi:hypothetical protein